MTLLVGVLCNDGVVIAADRQATHGAMGQQTVGQAVTKIRIIKGNDGLFASSGHHGLGQQLSAIVDDKCSEFTNQPYAKSVVKLQDHLRPLVDKSLKTAGYAARVLGGAAANDAICGSLLAAPFKDGLKLVEITPQIAVERMTDELPFISMGSGKPSADPFLGFLRKVYWPEGLPSLTEGVLAAYWTVKHAIDMKVSGVGFTADVFVVRPNGQGYVASQLSEAELVEHEDFMEAAEEALLGMREQLKAAPAAAAAAPPKLEPDSKDNPT